MAREGGATAKAHADVAIRPLMAGETTSILKAILQASDYGVLLTDLNHRSLACNPCFGELFGVDPSLAVLDNPDELRRKVLPIIAHPGEWLASLEEIYADPWRIHEDDLELNRSMRMVLRRYTGPVLHEDGTVLGRLWTFRDVTRERRLQKVHEVLHEIGTIHDPNPDEVCRRVLQVVSDFFDRSTAILSIRHGDYMDFKAMVGPLSPLTFLKGNKLKDSYCQLALKAVRPVLIQNARGNPEHASIKPAKFGYSRYLGVPVYDESGGPIGTLCILDRRSDILLDEQDVQLMSLVATRINAELARERHIRERLAEKDAVLQEQRQDLGTTHAVVNAMNEAFSMLAVAPKTDALVRRQTALLRGLLGYQTAAVLVADRHGGLTGSVVNRAGRLTPLAIAPGEDAWLERVTTVGGLQVEAACEASKAAKSIGTPYLVVAGQPLGVPVRTVILLGAYQPPSLDDERHAMLAEALVDQVRLLLASHLLQDEIVKANDELTNTRDQLLQSEKLSVVGTLAASTAHDIRNIVQSLALMTQPEAGDPSLAMAAVREQLDRFNVLAHRLLSYARPRLVSRQEVDLGGLLERVIGLTAAQARIHNVQASLRQDKGVMLIADPHQLEHLFVNLFMNAIQAMHSTGGLLTVSVLDHEGAIEVRVRDTGPGVPRGLANRLFEPFASSRADGFGLGLYSCRRIVEAHGGTVSVLRTSSKGTTFAVVLPKKPPLAGETE